MSRQHVTFAGTDLADFGVYISGSGVYNAPERDYRFVQSVRVAFGATLPVNTETETRLVRVLREDLSVIPNVRVFDEMLTDGEGTLLSFCVSGVHSEETAAALSDCGFAVRAGYHCAMLAHTCYGTEKTGTVRVSPGVFNQFAQIKKFTFCLNQIAMRKKIC